MPRLFISVERLDAWTAEGRVVLKDNRMVLTELDRGFSMTPAVCFVATNGQAEDPHDLVGRVRSKPQLEEMGAEQLFTSVIYADIAYEVIEGFVGDPLPP